MIAEDSYLAIDDGAYRPALPATATRSARVMPEPLARGRPVCKAAGAAASRAANIRGFVPVRSCGGGPGALSNTVHPVAIVAILPTLDLQLLKRYGSRAHQSAPYSRNGATCLIPQQALRQWECSHHCRPARSHCHSHDQRSCHSHLHSRAPQSAHATMLSHVYLHLCPISCKSTLGPNTVSNLAIRFVIMSCINSCLQMFGQFAQAVFVTIGRNIKC